MQQLQKVLMFTIGFICFTSPSLSLANSSTAHYFKGFYFGLGLGGSLTGVRQLSEPQRVTITYTELNTALGELFTTSGALSTLGPSGYFFDSMPKGTLYAGYGGAIKALYLGAEAFVDGSGYAVNNSSTGASIIFPLQPPGVNFNFTINTNTSITLSNFQFGLDFRPGFLLTPSLLWYGRIGAGYSVVNISSDISNVFVGGSNPFLSYSVPLNLTSRNKVITLRAGGGLEQYITSHLSLRLDYIFTYYGTFNLLGSGSVRSFRALIDDFGNRFSTFDTFSANNAEQIKIYNNTVMLELSYYIK